MVLAMLVQDRFLHALTVQIVRAFQRLAKEGVRHEGNEVHAGISER